MKARAITLRCIPNIWVGKTLRDCPHAPLAFFEKGPALLSKAGRPFGHGSMVNQWFVLKVEFLKSPGILPPSPMSTERPSSMTYWGEAALTGAYLQNQTRLLKISICRLIHRLRHPCMQDTTTPHHVRTYSRENSRTRKLKQGRVFEEKIEAGKNHLARVMAAAARRGGVESVASLSVDRPSNRGQNTKMLSETRDHRMASFLPGRPLTQKKSRLPAPTHLSPSPPAPVWELLLSPSTLAPSLAIGAAAGVGITFGVGGITRHIERKFDCGGKDHLARVRAAAARRGGVESRSVVSSRGRDAREKSNARGDGDDNPFRFAVLCCSGILDDCITRTDSLVMATSLDVDDLPEGCCRVYEFKMSKSESGGPSIHKARLVAQGFFQVPFLDYRATFATVAKSVTVCFDLTCVIFMRRPPPLPPGLWHLLKSIYGLKQASRIGPGMYIDILLAEHELTTYNSVVTPLDASYPLESDKNSYPAIENLTHAYQYLIGSLLFLQLCSRPDISFAVLMLSQFCLAFKHPSPGCTELVLFSKVLETLYLWKRLPAPSSSTPRTTTLLELIRLDICGPFPVTTPHGKAFPTLALRSNVRRVLKAKWGLKTGKRVERVRFDSAEELGVCLVFLEELDEIGVRVMVAYEHWKNGRIERHMPTIQWKIHGSQCFELPPNPCNLDNSPDLDILDMAPTLRLSLLDTETSPLRCPLSSSTPPSSCLQVEWGEVP